MTGLERAVAVEVRDLDKTFRIPRRQANTFKERVLHPLRSRDYDELHALDAVSFEIGQGEFYGIVGRNGSGKSTLLKCLAGIYAPDRGAIRVAGRLAPFIELGVGFNPNLAARDNVTLNAVMMGLSPSQARARFDEIIAFAELEAFTDLELKNYSSGMQVRLAFAVMLQADADVLLIDEVLAVGDASFQQKCFDEFQRLKDSGRTIVFVTHDMTTVERFCHRALLLQDGAVVRVGAPDEVAHHYLALNFEGRATHEPDEPIGDAARLLAMTALPDAVRYEGSMGVELEVAVDRSVPDAWITVWLDTAEGLRVLGSSAGLGDLTGGERLQVRVRIPEARLQSGRYYWGWSLERDVGAGDYAVWQTRAADVVVFDGEGAGGLIYVDHELEIERDGAPMSVRRRRGEPVE